MYREVLRKPKKIRPRDVVRLGVRDPSEERDAAIRKTIRSIPKGKVASYSQVAAAAGYPLYHRQVVRILRTDGERLPWQRVVGAGGYIKLRGSSAFEQRMRLEMEGVRFVGKRIDLARHQHVFRTWDLLS